MAIVQNPLIGSARKSVGGMTFARVDGKNILRTKPFQVKNPKTQAQVDNRERFKFVTQISQQIGSQKNYTIPEKRYLDVYNTLIRKIKKLSKDCLDVENSVRTFKASNFTIGGNKNLSYIPADFEIDGNNTAIVDWDKNQSTGQIGADAKIAVILINVNTGVVIRDDNSGDGYAIDTMQALIELPGYFDEGDVVGVLLETYSSTTDDMTGVKYATGWAGRPDIVGVDGMTATVQAW